MLPYPSSSEKWTTCADDISISIHTNVEDTLGTSAPRPFSISANLSLDPEDAIFPRAVTRVGSKYQANVPSWEEESRSQEFNLLPKTTSLTIQNPSSISFERGRSPGERKHESTIELWSAPSDDCQYSVMIPSLMAFLCN